MKPILFNTEMVQAILKGRKTVTRRVVKLPSYVKRQPNGLFTLFAEGTCYENQHIENMTDYLKPPYQVNDILYVRETWYKGLNRILYKANYSENEKFYTNGEEILVKWKPSIHMPKEAARIFLRVTDVRVERLQDIMRGLAGKENQVVREGCEYGCDFIALWQSTIKKDQWNIYGWEANPYVWVIEFERLECSSMAEALKQIKGGADSE